MKRLLGVLGVLLFGAACIVGTDWWHATEAGEPWPPEWMRGIVSHPNEKAETTVEEENAVNAEPEEKQQGSVVSNSEVSTRGIQVIRARPIEVNRREDYERKFAIIIGVNAYEPDSGLTDLNYAVNDAREFRQIMTTEFGYADENVHYLTAERVGEEVRSTPQAHGLATSSEVKKAFTSWLVQKNPTKRDAVLVFFAGHGWYTSKAKAGYVGLTDSHKKSGKETAVSMDWIKAELLNKLPPETHKLIILDCCFSGSLFEGRTSFQGTDVSGEPRFRIPIPGRTQLSEYLVAPAFVGISAGRLQDVADGNAIDGHSPFTRALLRVLRERANSIRDDHAFTFRQLASQVEGQVAFEGGSIQVPDWGRLAAGNGDFVFKVKGGKDFRHTPREVDLANKGKAILRQIRGSRQVPIYPREQIEAARAIGFRGYGARFLDSRIREEVFPRFFDSDRDQVEFDEAVDLVTGRKQGYAPPELLWTSPVAQLQGSPADALNALVCSPDGKFIAGASRNNSVIVWDGRTGARLFVFGDHTNDVTSLAFRPNRPELVSGSLDSTCCHWNLENGQLLERYEGIHSDVNAVAFHPDGKLFASGTFDGIIRLWDADSHLLLQEFEGRGVSIDTLTFGGRESLVSGSIDGKVEVWSLRNGVRRELWSDARFSIGALATHPSKTQIAFGLTEGPEAGPSPTDELIHKAIVLDFATGKVVSQFGEFAADVTALSFDPDSRYLIAGSGLKLRDGGKDNRLRLWDLESGELVKTQTGHGDYVSGIVVCSGRDY